MVNSGYSRYQKNRLEGKHGEMGSWGLVAPALEGKRTLDIGCSDGLYLRKFSPDSVGIEQMPELAEAARHDGLNVIQGDLFEALSSLDDSNFDAVLFSHVMEHLENPILALREINRVLKPGGMLVLGLPTENNIFRLTFGHDYFDGTHLYAFSVRNADKLLELNGFTSRNVYYHLPKFRGKTGDIIHGIWNKFPFPWKEKISMAYWIIAEKTSAARA